MKLTKAQSRTRVSHLMCRASEGMYANLRKKRYGIKVCKGELDYNTVEDLLESADLIKYMICTKNKPGTCNVSKLIETLT